MSDPAWLGQLVRAELEAYGMPAPAHAPALRPEIGGRGVILADPRDPRAGNAETVRLMAPGISGSMREGYMRYTDSAGGYVDPRTGIARFTDMLGSGVDVQSDGAATAAERRNWAWPPGEVGQPSFCGAADAARQQTIRAVVCDAGGWRVVIEAGALPEPRLYLDLDRPERRTPRTWQPAGPAEGAGLVGAVIGALALSDAGLELETSDGVRLRCATDRDFETWQLVVAGRGLWVGLPGGGIAVFEHGSTDESAALTPPPVEA